MIRTGDRHTPGKGSRSVSNYAEHLAPTRPYVWVICIECRTSVAVDTRQAYSMFEDTHRRLCGRHAAITPMFGGIDELRALPAT